ncbi:SPRY domain-containing protein [Bacillus sp. PK3_68]|uniref:SPRY domain-containing protein n=1 Tax=Bacillus sp. PK3_68 TaxID=2027408 RepID=UPI000E72F760|nr:SPRY domain-containing protein [Bacillus sp. PK3_68]RJS60102.1 hypothetical protein CJ483_08535 [Bacillus sp. PK3_68]
MAGVTWDYANKGMGTIEPDGLKATVPSHSVAIRASEGKEIGKWYWEIDLINTGHSAIIGVYDATLPLPSSIYTNKKSRLVWGYVGSKWNGTSAPYGQPFTDGDTLGIALDMDIGTIEFYKNGVNQGVAFSDLKTLGKVFPVFSSGSSSVPVTVRANFGATPFKYPVPLGFQPYQLLIKTLISSNDKYLKWNDAVKAWETVSVGLPSKSQFEQEGMEDLSVLNRVNGYSPLDELTGEIEIVVWTEEINAQKNLNMAAIPQDQLVLPTKDINIRSVENIDSFILNVTQAGQGAIKTVVSFDKGTTWYTRSSGSWIETDLANIKTEGITPAALNTITSSEWAALRGTSNTVRFAYHLSIEEITDIATVNDLISQMDMKGTWKKAVHGIDYDYEYPNNDQLSVTIYQNGDYKINY